ncbi:hypothetical protein ACHAXR_010229 [Thalassiosira sp. AJA248-18]
MVSSKSMECKYFVVAAATLLLLSTSLIAGTSAFTLPSSPIQNPSASHQCSPRQHIQQQPLFVQSKDSVFVSKGSTSLAENDDDDEDEKIITEQPTLAVKQVRPVFTTSEEAAIFMAEAPVTLSEGAFISEEGIMTGDGLFWRGVVVILCALWASNFACAKVVMSQPGVDTSLYAVARFSVAALSLLPGSINAARKGSISWETARGAVICGSWVAFGYLGQLIGLMTTTPSRACVICSLNCIFVAIVAELWRVNAAKERGFTNTDFNLQKLAPALIAVAGVAIIELKGAAGDPTIGDLISFAQPIGFGMGYLQLEELMKKQPSAALPVSAIKLVVVATAALIFFELSPHAATATDLVVSADAEAVVEVAMQSFPKIPDFTPILSSPVALGAIFYTGILTTSLALWVESIAFQRVPATDASIILTTEPLFAAAVSAFLIGETFGPSDAIGASFIIGACIYAIKSEDGVEEICDERSMECVVEDEL